nr:hypothetical protein [Campylobacterota bacterium]
YGLGSYQIKKNYNFNIFMEENDEKLYITMDNVVLLKAGLIESIIKKNYSNADYKILGNKVTFSIAKLDHSNTTVLPAYEKEEEETSTADVILNSEIQEVPAEVSKPMTASLVEVAKESEVEIQIFDFMDPEDLCEIEEITSEMRSLIMLVGNANLADEDIELLAFHIQKFGIVSSVYSETYAISSAMKQLSEDILANKERFLERASDIGVLCDAFSKDLLLWIQKLFYDGAPSIDFLDNSIISNANMITSFIKEEEVVQEEEALDDIFDF